LFDNVADCLDDTAAVMHDTWNDTDRANQRTGRETCHSSTLSTQISHGLVCSQPGLCGDRPEPWHIPQ